MRKLFLLLLIIPALMVSCQSMSVNKGGAVDATPEVVYQEPVMPILEDIFFDFDSFELTADAKDGLMRNYESLKDNDLPILIEGHCDSRGTDDYNVKLGMKRAEKARDFLVEKGISADRIEVISKSENEPLDVNVFAMNRRCHFVVK